MGKRKRGGMYKGKENNFFKSMMKVRFLFHIMKPKKS